MRVRVPYWLAVAMLASFPILSIGCASSRQTLPPVSAASATLPPPAPLVQTQSRPLPLATNQASSPTATPVAYQQPVGQSELPPGTPVPEGDVRLPVTTAPLCLRQKRLSLPLAARLSLTADETACMQFLYWVDAGFAMQNTSTRTGAILSRLPLALFGSSVAYQYCLQLVSVMLDAFPHCHPPC